jgi:hypothetical protein
LEITKDSSTTTSDLTHHLFLTLDWLLSKLGEKMPVYDSSSKWFIDDLIPNGTAPVSEPSSPVSVKEDVPESTGVETCNMLSISHELLGSKLKSLEPGGLDCYNSRYCPVRVG